MLTRFPIFLFAQLREDDLQTALERAEARLRDVASDGADHVTRSGGSRISLDEHEARSEHQSTHFAFHVLAIASSPVFSLCFGFFCLLFSF